MRALAATALAELVGNLNKDAIREKGGIRPLVQLLSDTSSIVRQHAVLALLHLIPHASRNQEAVRKVKGIEPLISLLREDNLAHTKQYAVEALTILAINPSNQDAIRKAGGISALVGLLGDKQSKVKNNAVEALTILAITSIVNQEAIQKAGAIEPLVGLLGTAEIREGAFKALEALMSKHRTNIVLAYELIFRLLGDERAEMRKAAAWGFAKLTVNPTYREVRLRPESLLSLVGLLGDDNVEVREYASCALVNLTIKPTYREEVRAGGGLPLLVKLLGDEEVDIRENVVWILRNLTQDDTQHVYGNFIRDAGGIPMLVRLLGEERTIIKERAVQTLMNISSNPVNQKAIETAGGIPLLIGLLRDPSSEVRTGVEAALKQLASAPGSSIAALIEIEKTRILEAPKAKALEAQRVEHERIEQEKKAATGAAAKAEMQELIRQAFERERQAVAGVSSGRSSDGAAAGGGGGSGAAVAPPILPSVPSALTKISYSALRFEDKLGEGGFGVVFKGTWEYALVAIKQLKLHRLSGEVQESFEKETQVMFGLRHPHIAQLLAVCLEPGRICMVMEYLPKGSLYHVLHDSKEPLGWATKYKIASQIASALAVLHGRDILHRDLKSPNVLLDEHDNAKLSDFGLARVKTETASTSTAGSVQGTVAWMAPECFKRGGKLTSKSDIYSLGMLLWELVTQKLPYEGAAAQTIVMTWIASGEKETIPEDTPAGLKKLIEDCWETDPSRRPEATVVFETVSRLSLAVPADEATSRKPGPKTAIMMGMAAAVARVEGHVVGMEAMQIARVMAEADATPEPHEPN